MRRIFLALPLVFSVAVPALAHEFWIDLKDWQIAVADPLEANIRVGQDMKGMPLSFIPRDTQRFEIVTPQGIFRAGDTIGDRPALQTTARVEGLNVIVHVTGWSSLTYSEFEKFQAFVDHKDLAGTIENHRARGLPDTDFRESYSRYAKALVAVGGGAGTDREMGLETEITALANPYTDDISDGLPVRLTYQGGPRVDAQIEVFARDAARQVTVFTLRTDNDGRAVIPVEPGNTYMLDAVVMRAIEPLTDDGAVWESLWANMTFAVPAARSDN